MTDTLKTKRVRRFARTPNVDLQPDSTHHFAGHGSSGTEPGTADLTMMVADTSSPEVPNPAAASKIGLVLTLLRRAEGATIENLTAATGWLPHSVRAALTGLRKKGHALEKTKRDDVTCYHISSSGNVHSTPGS
jgi:hypothetical protein